MHHVYHTEGFVLEGRPFGEANKAFSLLTQELGMVEATAQGVREGKSKLRMSLGDFSFSHLSLVRGRHSWKITGAKSILNLYDLFKGDREKLRVSVQSIALLKRLLHGEGKNDPLFVLLKDAFFFLRDEELSKEEIKNFEAILILRILHFLGYMGDKEELREFIASLSWEKKLLSRMGLVRQHALHKINQSLNDSHL